MNGLEKVLMVFAFAFGCIIMLPAQEVASETITTKYILNTPDYVAKDIDLLHSYLVKNASDDYQKVWAFYLWIAHHIRYDQEAAMAIDRKKQIPDIPEILQQKRAICTGYSRLLTALCERSNIPCRVIDGYTKLLPDSKPLMEESDHAWNAVKIKDQWYLIDVTWAAGLTLPKNALDPRDIDYYFLTPPEKLIADHLPSDPMWQLLPCPITAGQFHQHHQQMLSLIRESAPCFSFADSLQLFEQLSPADQKIKSLENAYFFNPTSSNSTSLGQAYMDRFLLLSEEEERLQSEGSLDTLLTLYPQLFSWAKKASQFSELHHWQNENLAYTFINYAVVLSRSLSELEGRALENQLLEMQSSLRQALGILESLPSSPFVDNGIDTCREYLSFVEDYLDEP